MEFSRPIPPPPPPRNSEMEPQKQSNMAPVEENHKQNKLSGKTKFGLLIAGGVLALAISVTCVVLIFIL